MTVTKFLLDEEFQCAFRMKRETFNLLLFRLRKYSYQDERQDACSSGGIILPAAQLAIKIRMLAGGSYHDQMKCWRVSRSMTFLVFLDTLRAVYFEFNMPVIPIDCESELKNWPTGFIPPEVVRILCTVVLELWMGLQSL